MKAPWYARLWSAIKWLAGVFAIALLGYGAFRTVQQLRQAARGFIVGRGRKFSPDPTSENRILVEDPDGPIPVQLPSGFTAKEVLAVGVAETTGDVIVEVTHVKKNRRAHLHDTVDVLTGSRD
jgi:hypothetical protein